MKHFGITGGIGSGKTTVCRIFETMGIPVYYADDRAKAIMVENEQVVRALKANFGDAVYHQDGKLDRNYLAGIVFQDRAKLDILNQIVHPAVFEDGLQWQQAQEAKPVPYTLKEAALLYESGSYHTLDKIIVVTAPEAVRIERVMQRDGISEQEVRARIDKQMDETEKVARADFVIHNDLREGLIPQVHSLHQQLLQEK